MYATELIVGIKNDGAFNWYILHNDICILDLNILEKAYRDKGFNFTINESYRFGIRVVEENTKELFLKNISRFVVAPEDLTKMMFHEKQPSQLLAYNPSLYIDFDQKLLLSYYPESESFEKYVPKGWIGKYQFFQDIIPVKYRYWELIRHE